MFAIVKNNAFQQFLPEGIAFKIGNTVYTQSWLNTSTPAEKAALGIVDVVYGTRPDDKYYWVTDEPPVYANGVVTIDYTAIPKDFAQCQKQAVNDVHQQAYSLLQPTDYIDIRNLRDPEYKLDWMVWRDEIRVQSKAQIALIEACKDAVELAALPQVVWTKDPSNQTI